MTDVDDRHEPADDYEPEPPDDYCDDTDSSAVVVKRRRIRFPRLPSNYAVRLGSVEVTIRRRPKAPCGACQGFGWFHTKGTLNPRPAPEGYDGVALCGCGTAHDELNDSQRRMRRWDRERRNQPPF